jgi:hypothetical protein
MKEFNVNCHINQWAYDEAEMIIHGHFMAEYQNEDNYFIFSFDDIE